MLDRLWAQWRSAYVSSIADEPDDESTGSVFRRILDSGLSDLETHIVWRGATCFAILNAYPYTTGHTLVMPYREVADLELLASDEFDELWAGVRMAVAAVKQAFAPDGLNVGCNLGRAAGAGVPSHVHLHVVPRWSGDTNLMTAVAEVRVMPESLFVSAAKVRAAWPSVEHR